MAEGTRSQRTAKGTGRGTKPGTGGAARPGQGRRRGPTPKGGRAAQADAVAKRYTAPIPRTVRHSPPWYPWLLLSLLVAGVLVIILNYVQALPASPTNWYTIGGVVALLAGALLATGYR